MQHMFWPVRALTPFQCRKGGKPMEQRVKADAEGLHAGFYTIFQPGPDWKLSSFTCRLCGAGVSADWQVKSRAIN